jgi:hypothetical protein
MAKIITTPIKISYYDNWAGYLMYLSVCGIATTGLSLITNFEISGTEYYNAIVTWFLVTIVSALIFGVVSREIALSKNVKAKQKTESKTNPYTSASSSSSSRSYQAKNYRNLTEAEKDKIVEENIKRGVIHL